MDFDKYIAELLYEHDCVIIPGLGGFLANYAPASIHPVQHTFSPPSKQISFNAGLDKNDGLLANYIAGREQISFEETLKQIEEFVRDCKLQLSDKKTIIINQVGRLQKDYDGNIQFWPAERINWLNDSYGLSKFVSPPVKRERTYKRPEPHFTDRKPVRQEKEKKRISKAVWLVIPALILAFWGFYNADLIKDIDANYSGIGQFIKHSLNEMPSFRTDATESTIEFEQAPDQIDHENENFVVIDNTEPEPISESEENIADNIIDDNTVIDNTVEAELPVEEIIQEPDIYFIIAGAFRSETNANNLVDNLQSKGYDSRILDQTPSGLYRVIYKGFVLKSEALKDLTSIREQDNQGAWLLKKLP